MMHLLRPRILTFLILAMALSVQATASVRVEKATVGFGGYIRNDRWAPVSFHLYNPGPDFQGYIEVNKGESTFRKSVDLASGARKEIQLLVYFNSYYGAVTFVLRDSQNRLRSNELQIETRLLNHNDNFILVISDRDFNHQFLNGAQNPWGGKTFVEYRKPNELPEQWLAYSTVDGIVLGTLSPATMEASQWNAVRQFVASGGTLIGSSATSPAVLQDPSFARMLPAISPELTLTAGGDFLRARWSSFSGEPFPELAIPAQQVTRNPADYELAPSGPTTSLITSSPYYKGNIIYFAYDYTQIPSTLGTVFAHYWNDSLFPSVPGLPNFGMPFRQRLEENARIQRLLYDVPGLKLPEVKWFALFFFAYICAVGPLQYFLLRVLKKNYLLWFTFPAIILLFALSSFAYSRMRHISRAHITQVSIEEHFPELSTSVISEIYGLTMERSGTFNFRTQRANSYLKKFALQPWDYRPEPFLLSEDLPYSLLGEKMKQWTFRTIDAIATESSEPAVSVTVAADGRTIRGTIVNSGRDTLNECFFFYNNKNTVSLGSIPPDSSRNFSLLLNDSSYVPFAEIQLRDLLDLTSLSYSNAHFFFAEKKGNGSLLINDTKMETSLSGYLVVYVNLKETVNDQPWAQAKAAAPIMRP